MFGSPIPRSQFESSSQHQTQYNIEGSPPYDQDDDEGNQDHNIKFIEKLVCDDDLEIRSNIDEQSSNMSMSYPDL